MEHQFSHCDALVSEIFSFQDDNKIKSLIISNEITHSQRGRWMIQTT